MADREANPPHDSLLPISNFVWPMNRSQSQVEVEPEVFEGTPSFAEMQFIEEPGSPLSPIPEEIMKKNTPDLSDPLIDDDFVHDTQCDKKACLQSGIKTKQTSRNNLARDDGLIECFNCGNIWDGHAQCLGYFFYRS